MDIGRINIYEGGFELISPLRVVKTRTKGGKRGTIKGWSRSSRRRMRDFLLKHDCGASHWLLSADFTYAGDIMPLSESNALWAEWGRKIQKLGWSAVWRKEIQSARGALHWHLLIWIPKSYGENPTMLSIGGLNHPKGMRRKRGQDIGQYVCAVAIQNSWLESIQKLGAVEYQGKQYESRLHIPGAELYNVLVQGDFDNDHKIQRLRYIQDHATKSKQAQCPNDSGRHWGVIGKKRFLRVDPDETAELSRSEYFKVLRWYNRLISPSIINEKSIFGREVAQNRRVGNWGHTVRFSRPDTIRRMIELAKGRLEPVTAPESRRQSVILNLSD